MNNMFNGIIITSLIFLGLLEIREHMCESEYNVDKCRIIAIPE